MAAEERMPGGEPTLSGCRLVPILEALEQVPEAARMLHSTGQTAAWHDGLDGRPAFAEAGADLATSGSPT